MPRLIKGSALNCAQRADVLRVYVNRYTGEHRPGWSRKPMPNGDAYRPEFSTDAEWLDSKAFYINKDGSLSKRHNHCEPAYLAD